MNNESRKSSYIKNVLSLSLVGDDSFHSPPIYHDSYTNLISPDTHTRSAGGALRQQKFTYFLKKISSPNKEKEGSDHCQRPACVQSEPHSRLTNGDEQRR